jgi:hypothetical protein
MSRKYMLAIAAASFLGTAPILAQQTVRTVVCWGVPVRIKPN